MGASGQDAGNGLELTGDGEALIDVRRGRSRGIPRDADDVAVGVEQRELEVVRPDAARELGKPLDDRREGNEHLGEIDFRDDWGGVVAVSGVDRDGTTGVDKPRGRRGAGDFVRVTSGRFGSLGGEHDIRILVQAPTAPE